MKAGNAESSKKDFSDVAAKETDSSLIVEGNENAQAHAVTTGLLFLLALTDCTSEMISF